MIKMVACSFYNTLIDKEDAIFIGDGPGDYESSKTAGIDFFYIDRYNIKELPLEQHTTLEDLIK